MDRLQNSCNVSDFKDAAQAEFCVMNFFHEQVPPTALRGLQ